VTVVKLAPSILTADFGRLADEVRAAEAGGADLLHLDVMDGRFVPVITFGTTLVETLRKVTSLPFDLHLMIVEPEKHVAAFADFVDTVNVHIEVSPHINRTLESIRKLGKRAGVCLNPGTTASAIEESIEMVDQVTVMTINPGWGGQQMIPQQLSKTRRIRTMLDDARSAADLMLDGGVKRENMQQCIKAGANVLVCGSSVFNAAASPGENLAGLRAALIR
jgi:ribulose-phosphate 3-epimerase